MAIKLKSISDIATKWARRAGAAGPDLEAGLRAPKEDWATATKNAEAAYQAGVQDSIGRGAFGKGVSEAGTEKWSRKALALAPGRYPQGVTTGTPDYQKEFAPYRDALERVALTTRGRRGDPANIERVRTIAAALHSQKTGGA